MGLAALLGVSACGGPSQEAYQAAVDRSQTLLKRNQQLELEAARRALADLAASSKDGAATPARLAELRRRGEEQAARIAELRTFVRAVRSALGQRGIEVTIRHGRMLVDIPEAVLFDSGQADLKGESRDVLTQMARLMRQSRRSFRVTGHTDNVPIADRRFRSNWELSTARAVAVVHFLTTYGVAPEKLAAVGRADNEPVGDNATAAGRAANRRIELVLEADLAEVVELTAAPRPRVRVGGRLEARHGEGRDGRQAAASDRPRRGHGGRAQAVVAHAQARAVAAGGPGAAGARHAGDGAGYADDTRVSTHAPRGAGHRSTIRGRAQATDACARMWIVLNGLWPRSTVQGRTATAVWEGRGPVTDDRHYLRDDVALPAARLQEEGVPEDLGHAPRHRTGVQRTGPRPDQGQVAGAWF